jgi:pilus assembly protein CpaC
MCVQFFSQRIAFLTILSLTASLAAAQEFRPPAELTKPSIVYKVQSASERMEMTVHTSRILTMDQKIAQVQVGNPEILGFTPLSPNQVQVSAKAAGVTQINLWDQNKKIFTIDVIIYGDVRELELMLRSTFPSAALKVVPVANSVLISGFVDKPEYIERIIRIAEEYYPKVINNMTVGGTQQVMLYVKVMEVSRTKLRQLGIDWANINGSSMIASTVSGLLLPPSSPMLPTGSGISKAAAPTTSNNPISSSTFSFNIASGNSAFFGVLNALQQENLMKITSEPVLTTISGRAANFHSGGTFFIPVPQSLGTTTAQPYNYGTSVDFVPTVLGNGKIRLEVKPVVSELDYTNATSISGVIVPGTKERGTDTGVEMQAGQTLAIAGLVQTRLEAHNIGLPWISEVPYLGAAFRNTKEERNEVELLILVRPELVEAMDAGEVPCGGPGLQTTSPNDWELYMKGHLEVPPKCPRTRCNGGCDPSTPPQDGMILGPDGEQIPAPTPSDASGRPVQSSRNGQTAQTARRQPAAGSNASSPYGRHTPSNPNSQRKAASGESQGEPPGLVGPAGYDVGK